MAPLATEPPPTGEIGGVSQFGVLPWGGWIDEREKTPELQWPGAVDAYTLMMNDAQVEGLLLGTTLPIRRYGWYIDPNGASQALTKWASAELNLPILGQEAENIPPQRDRFKHDRHLFHALRALAYGHYPFEIVGNTDDAGIWHLSKLAPRPPWTVSEFRVESNGDLVSIIQNAAGNKFGQVTMGQAPEIKRNRLLMHVWEKEGSNWAGRSMLRSCYKNWLIKDRLERVDAILIERAGGIPMAQAHKEATAAQIKALGRMARSFKVGEEAGGAMPWGAKLDLMKTGSSTAIESIRYHDQQMARRFLQMFGELGQTPNGSRALGNTFLDFFSLSQETIAGWYRDDMVELLEQMLWWSYGDQAYYPRLCYVTDDSNDVIAWTDLALLIEKGAIVVDRDLENAIRDRANLPPKEAGSADPTGPPSPSPAPGAPAPAPATAERRRRATAVAAGAPSPALSLPSRSLRRQPYEQEVQAQVDFAAMDTLQSGTTSALVDQVTKEQKAMIDELHDLVVEADGDLATLASLQAAPVSEATIKAKLDEVTKAGAKQVVDEAKRQGTTIAMPDLTAAYEVNVARAEATAQLLARSLSETAGRQALRFSGPASTAAEVADKVRDYLNSLTGSYLNDQIGGAIWQAQNLGRATTMGAHDPTSMYASELLDENTCDPCVGIDGTVYDTLEEAAQDYPTGGYEECDGRERCRGAVIAVWEEK